jgi:predicted component of type VI protein secretion system
VHTARMDAPPPASPIPPTLPSHTCSPIPSPTAAVIPADSAIPLPGAASPSAQARVTALEASLAAETQRRIDAEDCASTTLARLVRAEARVEDLQETINDMQEQMVISTDLGMLKMQLEAERDARMRAERMAEIRREELMLLSPPSSRCN